jgi:hypothetical protein
MKPVFLFGALALVGCGSSTPPPLPSATCDTACADGVVLYALRQTMQFVYNEALQGQPAGAQDAGGECLTGTAAVGGIAVPDGGVGSVGVSLSYELAACQLLRKNTTPGHNYDLTFAGTVSEEKTIAVLLNTSTMTLAIKSDALSFSGTVYDPPMHYEGSNCVVDVTQNGNDVTGTICGRQAGFSF